MARPREIDRDAVLDAAEAIMVESEGRGFTLDAVAERAGVSKGGLVYSFASKDALIAAARERELGRFIAAWSARSQAGDSGPEATLAAYVEEIRSQDEGHIRTAALLMTALSNALDVSGPARQFYQAIFTHFDGGTARGRYIRQAILAIEGLFLLRGLGLVETSHAEWTSVQGLSASLAIVTAMSSVRDVAEGVRATQIFALLMTVQGLGPVLAPAAGGIIGDQFGWRAVFLVLAGLGVLVLVSSFIMLPESLPKERREKLNPGAVAKTYAAILADGAFLLPALALAAVFTFLFAYIGGSAFAYQATYGLSASSFGLVFGGTGLAVLFGAMASAKLATRWPVQCLAMAGVSAILAGSVIALVSAATAIGLPGVVAGMFAALAGLGIAEATLMSIALASRTTALGASAAVLGAGPLMLGAAATPVAAYIVELGAVSWLIGLTAVALVALLLAWKTASLVKSGNLDVGSMH